MASSARLDELKKKFDENPRRYFAPLANEFRKMGEIEQAIMICEEFLPQQAGHMSGHIVYGQALFEAGRLEQSRTVFETALTLDPENLIALRHLGDIAKGNGELETARHWYTRVLDADPRNEEIQQLLYSLDDTPSVVLDETKLAAPNAPAAPGSAADQRFAPPPPAIPELPKAAAYAPPPPAIPQLPKDEAPPAPRAAQPPAPAPLDLDLDDALSEMSMPTTVSPVPNVERSESVNLEGLEPTSTGEMFTPRVGRAEGLEPSEFVPPPPSASTPSLIDSFEAGEFTAPTTSIAPLAGLEETSVGGAASAPPPPVAPPNAGDLPALDLDEGLSLAPQGDAVTAPMPSAAAPPPPAPPADDFLIPDASAGQRKPRPSMAHDLSGLPELDVTPGPPRAEPEIPAELPPPVLAAEAELVYLVPPDDVEEAPRAPAAAAEPFVTETMAELYLKQGFRDQALDVYRQLLAATPGDARLRARMAELQAQPAPAPAVRPPDTGPNVREFLARIATLRPGSRAAGQAPPSSDDFASFDSAPATAAAPANGAQHESWSEPSARAEPVEPRTPPAPTAETRPSGSIDALFGSRATTSEDSAASALAQAFGGAVEAPSMAGRPARAASKELSLDSVFRDASGRPPRASGSFSFDQFFSESASPPPAERPPVRTTGPHDAVSSEPAERTADDISQFNSWLQGLKQR